MKYLSLLLVLPLSSCCLTNSAHTVDARKVQPLIQIVTDDYRTYVESDESLDESFRADKLASADILDQIFNGAAGTVLGGQTD